MLPSKAGCLRHALFGCCLLAAASGCQFHRTGRGFVIQGEPWSLVFDRGCAAEAGESPPCKNCSRIADVSSADQAAVKPELLPWRSRLKGYRLAARLFHRGESDGQESPAERPPLRPRTRNARRRRSSRLPSRRPLPRSARSRRPRRNRPIRTAEARSFSAGTAAAGFGA